MTPNQRFTARFSTAGSGLRACEEVPSMCPAEALTNQSATSREPAATDGRITGRVTPRYVAAYDVECEDPQATLGALFAAVKDMEMSPALDRTLGEIERAELVRWTWRSAPRGWLVRCAPRRGHRRRRWRGGNSPARPGRPASRLTPTSSGAPCPAPPAPEGSAARAPADW